MNHENPKTQRVRAFLVGSLRKELFAASLIMYPLTFKIKISIDVLVIFVNLMLYPFLSLSHTNIYVP